MYQQSFLNRDSFLNQAFLNRECTVSCFTFNVNEVFQDGLEDLKWPYEIDMSKSILLNFFVDFYIWCLQSCSENSKFLNICTSWFFAISIWNQFKGCVKANRNLTLYSRILTFLNHDIALPSNLIVMQCNAQCRVFNGIFYSDLIVFKSHTSIYKKWEWPSG